MRPWNPSTSYEWRNYGIYFIFDFRKLTIIVLFSPSAELIDFPCVISSHIQRCLRIIFLIISSIEISFRISEYYILQAAIASFYNKVMGIKQITPGS